ncbi:hypothetical protein ABEB36_014441 [Hypothenemus hampei]|uniref:Uncharacterized protein n=1 Tax=Hypothenemus hampei TaxID=57062 RepID=A0ABD1E2P9_HYPHA
MTILLESQKSDSEVRSGYGTVAIFMADCSCQNFFFFWNNSEMNPLYKPKIILSCSRDVTLKVLNETFSHMSNGLAAIDRRALSGQPCIQGGPLVRQRSAIKV